MKKTYKFSRGVTLVEVIIAMTIFAIMAGTIMTVIMKANQISNRSKMRDVELATETNIIGRNKASARDEIQQVKPNGYEGDYKIVFSVPGKTIPPVNHVKIYETNEGRFDQDFDFKLKTIVPSSSLSGLPLTNLADNEYSLRFENNLSEAITITITIEDGYLFEGDGQKYVHTTKSYVKTLPANSTADVGYFYSGSSNVSIGLRYETSISGSSLSGLYATGSIEKDNFVDTVRKAVFTISQSGTDPSFVITPSIPTT